MPLSPHTSPATAQHEVAHRETWMNPADFAHWAARQPLEYELVDGHPVRLPKEQQAPFRLKVVKALADAIFDQPDHATAWMANASP